MKHPWIPCLLIYGFTAGLTCVAGHPGGSLPGNSGPDTAITVAQPDNETAPASVATTKPLSGRLEPVRTNFTRINTVAEWTDIRKKELEDTTEGGEAIFYYLEGKLEKIVARRYGETFQQITEYYLMDGRLSFVYEKTYRYNRPIYYDPAEIDGSEDTEAFDFSKSEITEIRSYFENGLLFHRITDPGKPVSEADMQAENLRIQADFEQLKPVTGM